MQLLDGSGIRPLRWPRDIVIYIQHDDRSAVGNTLPKKPRPLPGELAEAA
jgi:hypothetical protein